MEGPTRSNKKIKLMVAAVIVLLVVLVGVVLSDRIYLPPKFYGEMTQELQSSELFADLESGGSVCFVGDSITAGTETKGLGWYEPLVPYIKGEVKRFADRGWTSRDLLEHKDEMPNADIYVIAIGVNDVTRPQDGAATPEEFVENLEALTEGLEGKVYYIAPWNVDGCPETSVQRRQAYADCLRNWSETAIDPYPAIRAAFDKEGEQRFMRNELHPNLRRGLGLYSYAVLVFFAKT